jgi:hypothetical protein
MATGEEVQPEHHEEHRNPEIIIDERPYRAPSDDMTGEQLRDLANPPIGEDRDLWLERPDDQDVLIRNDERVELRSGMRFFSTPRHINPGRSRN